MTRFKESRRIEAAIELGNERELQWALAYCQMRRKLAANVRTMGKQEKYWMRKEDEVRSALASK